MAAVAPVFFGWLRTREGVRDGIFKTSYHAVDWYQIYTHGHAPTELVNFRGAMKDAKNAMSFGQLIEKTTGAVVGVFNFIANPGLWNGYQASINSIKVVSPICDVAEFINSRATPIAIETLNPLRTLSAAATAVLSLEEMVNHAIALPHAPTFEAMCSEMIAIAKCISYLALTAIVLISTFYAPIAYASFWILVCSTSALAFTIINEFV